MKTIQAHKSIVLHSRYQEVARQLPENCADVVIADWPFNKGIVDKSTRRSISDGVKLAYRLLKPNATFVSVNYEEPNHEVWNEAQKVWGMTYADTINLPRHPMKKVKFRMAYAVQPAYIFCKGELKDRVLNCECKEKYFNLLFSKSTMNVLTNFWDEIKFRNGFRRKNGDRVNEAMPLKTVEKMLKLFTPENGLVIDFFGGAGTVPLVCRSLNFRCISTEIQEERFEIIKRRLEEDDGKFIELSSKLLDKAIELSESYTKGASNGKTEEDWQGKRQGCSEDSKV